MMTDLDNIWGNNNAQTDDATVAADAHWWVVHLHGCVNLLQSALSLTIAQP